MTPIETRYAGCLFRSRLEARWAVFFNTLDVRWDYEREGYRTRCGGYLPDFFLHFVDDDHDRERWPGAGHWFEIKPTLPDPAECEKLMDVCQQTSHFGRFLCGPPNDFCFSTVEPHRVRPFAAFAVDWDDCYEPAVLFARYAPALRSSFTRPGRATDQIHLLSNAIYAARAARFE